MLSPWAIFESLTLGEFGTFFACANSDVKLYTSATLHLPSNLDADGKITEYIIYDFIVRVNTNRCTSGGHRLKDIKCSVPLGLFSGGVRRVEVPAAYCYVCDKYYILDEDYEMLKKKGVVLAILMKRKNS